MTLALILAEIILKIIAAKAGGDAATIPGLILKMASKLNQLSVEEIGQPIDWDKIKEHGHLGT